LFIKNQRFIKRRHGQQAAEIGLMSRKQAIQPGGERHSTGGVHPIFTPKDAAAGASDMVVRNPAPNASPPYGPSGIYREYSTSTHA
jgi:hypothetical protein